MGRGGGARAEEQRKSDERVGKRNESSSESSRDRERWRQSEKK